MLFLLFQPFILRSKEPPKGFKVNCSAPDRVVSGKPMPAFFWRKLKAVSGCVEKKDLPEPKREYASIGVINEAKQ